MNAITHPKKRGEWVESLFLARAVARGLNIAKPWGDCSRYDFILDSAGRLLRIQVKGTSYRPGPHYIGHVFSHPPGQPQVGYRADEVDFLAIYLIPEDLWYIIPIAVVVQGGRNLRLDPRDPTNPYHGFLEAWHLLEAQQDPDPTRPA
jgi:hypothetical protein